MAKVKWGSVNAQEIDEFEDEGFSAYDGPDPKRGVYGFKIKFMKTGTSSGGHDQMIVGLELDSRGRADHKKYAGFFMQDFIIVKDDTVFRYAPLLKALGIPGKDFLTKTITDPSDDDNDTKKIVKIGTVKPIGMKVVGSIWPDGDSGYYKIKYLPGKADDDAADDDTDDTDDGEEAPF